MEQKSWVKLNGYRMVIYIDLENRTVRFPADRFPTAVPKDSDCYTYTHGGIRFKIACDRFWVMERRASTKKAADRIQSMDENQFRSMLDRIGKKILGRKR